MTIETPMLYRLAFLIAALLWAAQLAGCDNADTVAGPVNTEAATPAQADALAAVAVGEWSTRLGIDLDPADLPVVRWFDGECLSYPGDGSAHCRDGAYNAAADEIDLLVRADAVSFSSLAHEVLHWSLLQATGDSDNGHDGALWADVSAVQGAMLEVER